VQTPHVDIGHQGIGAIAKPRNLRTLNRQWLSTYIQSGLHHEALAPMVGVLEPGPFVGQPLALFNFLFRMGAHEQSKSPPTTG
jgi:hypothetical protein